MYRDNGITVIRTVRGDGRSDREREQTVACGGPADRAVDEMVDAPEEKKSERQSLLCHSKVIKANFDAPGLLIDLNRLNLFHLIGHVFGGTKALDDERQEQAGGGGNPQADGNRAGEEVAPVAVAERHGPA